MTEDQKMEDILFRLAIVLREKRARLYPYGRDIYKNKRETACEADHEYMGLNITEEQRMLWMTCWNNAWMRPNVSLHGSICPGLLDGIAFLRDFGFLDMYITEDTSDSGEVGGTEKRELSGCTASRNGKLYCGPGTEGGNILGADAGLAEPWDGIACY